MLRLLNRFLGTRSRNRTTARAARRPAASAKPGLEVMEDRLLMSVANTLFDGLSSSVGQAGN
jgi:hypothetical protein